MTGRDLVRADQLAVEQRALQAEEPFLIIRGREIDRRRYRLARKSLHVDVEVSVGAHRPHHGHHAALPPMMEGGLVGLDLDFAEAVHAAHVVHAVHDSTLGRPVPIMLSRVTIAASCSSLQPSVPAGRIGSTRKRVSAVESQTRISVSFESATPKSASTPRGSFTARER